MSQKEYNIEMSNSFQNDPVVSRSQEQSSFHAYKSLLNAEVSLTVMRNRIRVLQQLELKNELRIQNKIILLGKLNKARSEYQNATNTLQEKRDQRQQHKLQQQRLNKERRNNNLQSIKAVKQAIFQDKTNDYSLSIRNSKLAEDRILKEKNLIKQIKAEKHHNIIKKEEEIRTHIVQYHSKKNSKILSINQKQIAEILRKKDEKERQIKQIYNKQMQLLQKQSNTMKAYEEVKSKLDGLLMNVRVKNSDCRKNFKNKIR